MNLIGNINAIPFRRFRGGGGVAPFPYIPGMIARYSALGLTNEQMAANPVWKDLTGNGHDLQMKNFAWGGMSGVGGYNQNFNQWGYGNLPPALQTYTPHKVELNIPSTLKTGNIYSNLGKEGDIYDFTLKIVGLKDGASLRITKGVVSGNIERIEKDGIYKIYQPLETSWDQLRIYIVISNPNLVDLNITIEQLPIYPGALVFDGVDDYGVCDNFPILTKEKGYTVVALRQWIEEKNSVTALASNSKNWNQDGAFVFEYNNLENNFPNIEISFGSNNVYDRGLSPYSYQTSKSYNGNLIESGSFLGSDKLVVAKANENLSSNSNIAIWELVFLDHDATEEELTKIKDYFVKTYPWLFPDQAWTVTGKTNEDEDRATIANITGNGNDLVLSNFAFSGNSGYGSYVYNFNDTSTWLYPSYNGTIERTSSTIHVIEAKTDRPFFEKKKSTGGYNKMKIKVTGIKDGELLRFMSDSDIDNAINIEKDGIYSLPGSDKLYYGFRLSNSTNTYPFNCDITIEQIPEYEGYLVTDGVDDKITSSAFKMGKDFTVVGEWKFLKEDVIKLAGFVKYDAFMFYNYSYNNRINIYIYSPQEVAFNNVDTIKAVTSEGQVYFDFNSIKEVKPGDLADKGYVMNIGHNGSNHTKLALKNFAIYPTVLSKDDCIKAYNYLQTLKAK